MNSIRIDQRYCSPPSIVLRFEALGGPLQFAIEAASAEPGSLLSSD
jgi:hypothetical protein